MTYLSGHLIILRLKYSCFQLTRIAGVRMGKAERRLTLKLENEGRGVKSNLNSPWFAVLWDVNDLGNCPFFGLGVNVC